MKNNEVTIYTDGSSLGNPGPGGWAAVMLFGGKRKEISGGYNLTTNNRMEILAVIEALAALKQEYKGKIIIHSDSALLVNSINKGWLTSWQRNGWKKADKKPVLNQDLWTRLLPLLKHFKPEFRWVKAHAGLKENERCDELCKIAASQSDLPMDEGYMGGEE